jgi:hypothetical protein
LIETSDIVPAMSHVKYQRDGGKEQYHYNRDRRAAPTSLVV